MSGVAGADRVKSRQDFQQFLKSYKGLISQFPGFVSLNPSGSYNSNLEKNDFGDIDLIVHIQSDQDKATVKKQLQAFFMKQPETVIVPFSSAKHAGKRSYNAGELVSVRYHDDHLGYSAQIDNIVALDQKEAGFKQQFLDWPAEKQGLILGLIKIAAIETDPRILFKKLGIPDPGPLEEGQEYEFNLSSVELQLRRITYKPGTYEQLGREVLWNSRDFDDIQKLLYQYNLDADFDQLLAQSKQVIKNPRSNARMQGVFSSMITVKSGEVGTAKGAGKEAALAKIQNTFRESRNLLQSLLEISAPSTVVFAFGRLQPPTIGHEILVNTVKQVAKQNHCPYVIYVSKTVGKSPADKLKNPLTVDQKMMYLGKMFPGTHFAPATDQVRTPIEAAKYLNEKYQNLILIAGGSRAEEFEKLLNDYNGRDYNFNSIRVIKIDRDPDADDASGMSGTKMRQAAMADDFEAFRSGLPGALDDATAQQLMQDVKAGMTPTPKIKKTKEAMLPTSAFAGSKKNKLGPAGQWKNTGPSKNRPARAGDLVGGAAESINRQGVAEAFDQPYKGKWEKSDYGDVDMLTKLPDGTNLSIMFNNQQGEEGEEVVQVEFYRNNSQDVTGEGDAQRIFATVLDAIQKYIKKYKPQRLSFSASKAVDMDADDNGAQVNPESRAKLYDRLVQRYSKALGYRAFRADNGDIVIYELSRIKQGVAEAVDIGQEWMSDTELDQYVPERLQQQWRELLGYDMNGNPSAYWANLTGGYEPDVHDPQHRALMVKVANKWFAAKKIPNVKFFDVKDADDELEWLVQIGEQGVAEGLEQKKSEEKKKSWDDYGLPRGTGKTEPKEKVYRGWNDYEYSKKKEKEVAELMNTKPDKSNQAKWRGDDDLANLNFVASNGIPYQLSITGFHAAPDEVQPYDFDTFDNADGDPDLGRFIEFIQEPKPGVGYGKQGIEGTGAAAEVFGIVYNAIAQYVKKHKLTFVMFQAAEPSRRKLYSALTRKMLQTFPGWKYEEQDGVYFVYNSKFFPQQQENIDLSESNELKGTLRTIANDIGEPITNVYETLKHMAKRFYDSHGDLKGFGMVAGGVGGRWFQTFYFNRLQNELFDLSKQNTKITVPLQQFLRGTEVKGKIENAKGFSAISKELPDILAEIGAKLNYAPLANNARRWMHNREEYEQYLSDLELSDYEDDDKIEKAPKAPKDPEMGKQRSQAEDIVNDVLRKLPSKIAGDIRNAIARAPNKLQALQQELQKRGVKVPMENMAGVGDMDNPELNAVYEHKKGVKAVKYTKKPKGIEPPKPRNFVAKNAVMGGAGAHKNKKKEAKHKHVEIGETWEREMARAIRLLENK